MDIVRKGEWATPALRFLCDELNVGFRKEDEFGRSSRKSFYTY